MTNVFPKNHEQLYGSQIIGTASDPISLQHVEEAVRSRYLDSDDILQAFSDMIVFDAWIGNMDRHHENWAITQTSIAQQMSMFSLPKDERERLKKKRWFTQLYDHGSSLLFELGEEKVRYYLEHQEQFVKDYILGKKYALLLGVNDKEMNIFDIIQQNIENKTNWSKRLKKSIAKICAVDSLKVAQAIMQMPTDGLLAYSADRKSLLYLSLEKRREILRGMI